MNPGLTKRLGYRGLRKNGGKREGLNQTLVQGLEKEEAPVGGVRALFLLHPNLSPKARVLVVEALEEYRAHYGREASNEDIATDACAWAANFVNDPLQQPLLQP